MEAVAEPSAMEATMAKPTMEAVAESAMPTAMKSPGICHPNLGPDNDAKGQ